MSFPQVKVNVANGNLMQSVAVLDSVPALMLTVSTEELVAKTQEVYSLADAESKGYTAEAEPFAHHLIEEYYNELGGNQRLFIFGTAASMTMAEALTATEANGVSKLLRDGRGDINLIAIARKPQTGYQPGTAFLDSDVSVAVTACKTVGEAMQTANTPVRFIIEGRVANAGKTNDYKPTDATNGYACVLLGGTSPDGSAAVSVLLARACKYGSHIKVGNGQNGVLSVQQVYIGVDKYEDRVDMETLHDAGFLTFMHRPGSAGYYFGRDNMCSKDDFRILVHGRVIDKAQRIAAATYAPYIETGITMNADGTVNATEAADIENTLEQAVLAAMGDQISQVRVYVDLNQDIINTSTINIQLRIMPLGYLTWITVSLGLAATL
nr:MAG TPA: tail sheath protein [Caudoviricetes sp.]